jgi:hypothetical protein
MHFAELGEQGQERAKRLGYCGLFSHRETLQDASDYALEILKNCAVDPGDNIALLTGLAVITNTAVLLQVQLEEALEKLKSGEKKC